MLSSCWGASQNGFIQEKKCLSKLAMAWLWPVLIQIFNAICTDQLNVIQLIASIISTLPPGPSPDLQLRTKAHGCGLECGCSQTQTGWVCIINDALHGRQHPAPGQWILMNLNLKIHRNGFNTPLWIRAPNFC